MGWFPFSMVVSGADFEEIRMGDTDTLGLKNQGDRPLWEDPDPRVKWALDLFDNQGYEVTPYRNKFFIPTILGSIFASPYIMMNYRYVRPLYTGAPIPAALFAIGFGMGWKYNEHRSRRQAELEAVTKHYIMLHPDRFPEPEMKKFGDKEVFTPWKVNRGM